MEGVKLGAKHVKKITEKGFLLTNTDFNLSRSMCVYKCTALLKVFLL